jgi:hypothetical protein
MTARVSPFGVDTESEDGGGSPSPALFSAKGICIFFKKSQHMTVDGYTDH